MVEVWQPCPLENDPAEKWSDQNPVLHAQGVVFYVSFCLPTYCLYQSLMLVLFLERGLQK